MSHAQGTVIANLERARQQAEKMAIELDLMFPGLKDSPDEDKRNHLKRYLMRIENFVEAAEDGLNGIWGLK